MDIEDFEIDEHCIPGFPCQHQVVITTKDWKIKYKLLTGVQICELFIKHNRKIPEHFQQYQKNPKPS